MMELDRKRFNLIISRVKRATSSSYQKHEVVQFRGEDSPLFQAIAPAFYIIRVFGLGPYHFSKDRLVPSNFHLIFSFLALIINSYIVITVLIRFTIKGNQPILGITEQAKVILNYTTMFVNVLVAMCTRERFVEVWRMIQDFDYKTNELGFPQMENGTKLRVWGKLLLNVLIWVWVNQTGMFAFEESWLQNVSYLIVYVSTSVSVFKFSGVVFITGLRFTHLNKIARTCSPNEMGWQREPKIDSKVIERFYDDLLSASRKLNSVYSWPLLLWLFNVSSHTVSNTYFIITSFMDHDFEMFVQLCLMGWFVAYVIQLIALHIACDFTSREEFESTLHLMNDKLNFSAGGCCYVNLPLLRSISGLLTTYLFILLQLPDD